MKKITLFVFLFLSFLYSQAQKTNQQLLDGEVINYSSGKFFETIVQRPNTAYQRNLGITDKLYDAVKTINKKDTKIEVDEAEIDFPSIKRIRNFAKEVQKGINPTKNEIKDDFDRMGAKEILNALAENDIQFPLKLKKTAIDKRRKKNKEKEKKGNNE